MGTRSAWLVFFAVVAGACTTIPRTQVMLVVTADAAVMARATEVRIEVAGGPSYAQLTPGEAQRSGPELAWPLTLALVPRGGDASRVYRLEVSAIDDSGAPFVNARAESGYRAQETLRLHLHLVSSCASVCDTSQTCRDGRCASARIDPGDLPPYDRDAGDLVPDSGGFCGDGRVGAGEDCEGTELGARTCTDLGFESGTLACAGCAFDTSGCVAGPSCGDGSVDSGEQCDDGAREDGDGCSAACASEDGWSCTGAPSVCETTCGDGTSAGAEMCDDGFTDACGSCNADCSGPGSASTCGDGVVCPETEVCDDHNDETCGSCDATCTVVRSGRDCGVGTGCGNSGDCYTNRCNANTCV